MRYLTKKWYALCQMTDLHGALEVLPRAAEKDDLLFATLYEENENEHIQMERELYDTDPRFMLEGDGSAMFSVKALLSELAPEADDIYVHETSAKERAAIEANIQAFDARPPFNPADAITAFQKQFERSLDDLKNLLPTAIVDQIADPRVYALGYASQEVYDLVKLYSEDNDAEVTRTLEAFEKAQLAEDLPTELRENFGAHDAKLLNLSNIGEDLVLILDPEGSFTEYSEIRFTQARVIQSDEPLVGSYWLYNELYRAGTKYEAHVLFSGESIGELVVTCDDILMI